MDKDKFNFTYSAPTEQERREIESIKNQYLYSRTNTGEKLEELKKLDKRVKNIPTMISLILGIVGTLIFGTGLTMVLEWDIMIWGVVVSIIGIAIMSIAYPVYARTLAFLKQKYGDRIIKLSDELLSENNNKNE